MFEESVYLPPNYPTVSRYNIVLPNMPSRPVLNALYQYGPGVEMTLYPHIESTDGSALMDAYNKFDGVGVVINEPLDVGYGKRSQHVLCTVKRGGTDIIGTKVVLRFF